MINLLSKKMKNLKAIKKYIDSEYCTKLSNPKMHDFITGEIRYLEEKLIDDGDLPYEHPFDLCEKFIAEFRLANETREFNSILFAITLLNSFVLDNIISSGFYLSFCESAFYNRKHSNNVNEGMVWDCVFNYFLNKFINLYRVNFDGKIFEILALDKDDEYFSAFCTAVDKFCVDKKINIPIEILDSFYKKDSRHFEKIKKMGLI